MKHKKHHKRKNIMGNLPSGRFSRQSIARPHPVAVRSDTAGNVAAEQTTDEQTTASRRVAPTGNTDEYG
ncbi:hypothetical protein Uis1B_1760 [Bifidobacterium margollesii]|uniref:Uncharacterized protein n=1 Tax=Bifidobacterium margollesii TaxID=2020964 RepID=A0A2N5J879_9BIFI|nr:hypothetical protein Uis1B_1760 [Bifidobacterium margollesii]